MRLASEITLTFLLNALWQVPLIAGMAVAAAWLLRNCSARYRHNVWVVALASSFLLPAFTSARLTKADDSSPTSPSQSSVNEFKPQLYAEVVELGKPPAGPVISETKVAAPNSFPRPVTVGKSLAIGVLSFYALFVFYRVQKLWRAWRKTRATIRAASAFEWSDEFRSALNQCQRFIATPSVRVLSSRLVAVPVTAGIRQPLIILPDDLLKQNDRDLLTSAIGHELVHIVRRDYLMNLICEFIFLPISFHPAAAVVRRQIQRTRELCCDEIVATQLMSTRAYAQSLVRLINAMPALRPETLDTTIGIAEWDNLEVRIMSLLKRKRPAKPQTRTLLAVAAILFVAPFGAATSLALSLEIAALDPVVSPVNQPAQPQEPKEIERRLAELQSLEQSLTRQTQEAPIAQRPALEKRLREVRQTLAEHERLVTRYYEEGLRNSPPSQRPEVERRLREVQENLAAHERLVVEHFSQHQARVSELKQALARVESQTPRDERLIQSLKERLADLETYSAENTDPGQDLNRIPRTIYRAAPSYPVDAREKGISGPVRLSVTVNLDGTPTDIRIEKPLYPSLDQAAVEAVQRMRFAPALKNGQPVAQRINLELYFGLEKGERGVVTEGEPGRSGLDRERMLLQESRESELAREAVISMDSAIQIATSMYPGKVVSCALGREKNGPVFYHVVIVNHEGEKRMTRYVWVNAIDGTILRTEDGARMPGQSGGNANGGIWNHRAIRLPPPAYPPLARAAQAAGSVVVEIEIDENGDVISASAVSGHPLLRSAAVDAARRAKFAPSQSPGGLGRATGRLVYNFVAN